MQPLISVIVPIYNVEKYLNRCIVSIVNQTYKNLEIILVDDGSPDNCPKMCDAWAEKDSRIKVIHKPNGGLSSARNAGMDVMQGQYVIFIDSDDYLELNAVEIMYSNISDDDYDVCICNHYLVDKDYTIIDKDNYQNAVLKNEKVMQEFLRKEIFDPICATNKMYKTSVIEDAHLRFDETIKWGECHPFNYQYFKLIKSAVSIDDVLYNYLVEREGSITHKMNSGQAERWRFTKEMVIAEKDNPLNYPIVLSSYASLLMCIIREVLHCDDKEFAENHYSVIVNEINQYYKEFMKLTDLNIKIKYGIKFIHFSPKLFKLLYSLKIKF